MEKRGESLSSSSAIEEEGEEEGGEGEGRGGRGEKGRTARSPVRLWLDGPELHQWANVMWDCQTDGR